MIGSSVHPSRLPKHEGQTMISKLIHNVVSGGILSPSSDADDVPTSESDSADIREFYMQVLCA